MKWGILVVALIIGSALYYFWTESHFETKQERRVPETEVRATVETRMSEDDPKKEIPPGTIMEDGTI